MEQNHYYAVTCKFGHVGRRFYVRKTVPVVARSKKEASAIARNLPRVKHDHKDAILDCVSISFDEYISLHEMCDSDPYFHVTSTQEQSRVCDLTGCLEVDEHNKVTTYVKTPRKCRVERKLRKYELELMCLDEDLDYAI